jgi:alginate O-acetyltransferase complex protein AlgI
MIFNTWEFGVFAVLFFFVYWILTPARARLWVLVAGGVIFYLASVPIYTLLIVSLAAITYVVGKLLVSIPEEQQAKRRALLAAGIAASLGALVYFKDSNFFLTGFEQLCPRGCGHFTLSIVVPLALSFFTFEFVHFLVDVYLGKIREVRLREFALFAMFFPTLVAGPIKRYQNFVPQIPRIVRPDSLIFTAGVYRVVMGLAKKMIIADSMTPLTQPLLTPSPLYHSAGYWVGMMAYTAKIYFDFTGYSDIAIGLSAMLGFQILENFDRPYWSTNISEFWRRWHISLSSWIRDYIFIPLGGSRGGKARTIANLTMVMALAGLWHGAAWHFVVWGLWHGAGLGAHRIWSRLPVKEAFARLPIVHPLSVAFTFLFVAFGWVLFASPTLPTARAVYLSLVGGHT